MKRFNTNKLAPRVLTQWVGSGFIDAITIHIPFPRVRIAPILLRSTNPYFRSTKLIDLHGKENQYSHKLTKFNKKCNFLLLHFIQTFHLQLLQKHD